MLHIIGDTVNMIIFCPQCRFQHIDKPELENNWNNPPHKSHLCHHCKCVFRFADIPTNGVKNILSIGDNDTWDVNTLGDRYV